jgi:hypothetical protein
MKCWSRLRYLYLPCWWTSLHLMYGVSCYEYRTVRTSIRPKGLLIVLSVLLGRGNEWAASSTDSHKTLDLLVFTTSIGS